ncbi:hypothetical protein SPSYN_00922 [Sporotomaculum syntrophicum]|uniref:Copper amine oxidase-like N-terminal domain-containing protein n=1 Tax=Sporotomaculum syntrophicum TaxID=182264 RepID=A0A9D2WSN4_9FIRM|nr:copper amine oxidase N-terminal domain-containing protein [Sporotomaculum syntrophicum]KAF1086181.1 hypothetical protein SPSYN_00922 [Sporotomaculum syntrophicum]
MVPIRIISEAFSYQVTWNKADKSVGLNTTSPTIFKENSFLATINGVEKDLPVPVLNYKGALYVPLRVCAESLGAEVVWDPKTGISLNSPRAKINIKSSNLIQRDQSLVCKALSQGLIVSNEILRAAEAVHNQVKGNSSSDLKTVINRCGFTIFEGKSYFVFYLEPLNMAADSLYAIVKYESSQWFCTFWGVFTDPEDDKYWRAVYDSTGGYSALVELEKSIVIDLPANRVYFSDKHLKSYNETQKAAPQPPLTIENYQPVVNEYQKISISELAKAPFKYDGINVQISGRIIYIKEIAGFTQMLISNGIDIVAVDYFGTTSKLKGNYIIVNGQPFGQSSDYTLNNMPITVTYLMAKQVY